MTFSDELRRLATGPFIIRSFRFYDPVESRSKKKDLKGNEANKIEADACDR
jgi:hypothetical protein